MPVKIVIYAENIADGTEIVNFALKVGGALSVYDPKAESPIMNGAAKKSIVRIDPTTLYEIDTKAEVSCAEGSVRARVWDAVEKLSLPLTRREISKQATSKCRKLTEKQVVPAVKWMVDTGILKVP